VQTDAGGHPNVCAVRLLSFLLEREEGTPSLYPLPRLGGAMSSAIGGGEAATALAGAVILAINAFMAGLQVDDPCLLFESAVEVVRANGRAAFTGCNAEFRSGSPATGPSSSSSSSSSSSATAPPSSPRAPPAGARSVAPVAPLVIAAAVSAPARPPAVAPRATRPAVRGVLVAGTPRGAALSGTFATSTAPAHSRRVGAPLPSFTSWARILRRRPPAPSGRGSPPPPPPELPAAPAAAAPPDASRAVDASSWTLVERRRRRRGGRAPPRTPGAAVVAPPALAAAPSGPRSEPPPASNLPRSAAPPPLPAARAASAFAALSRPRRGGAPLSALTTIYVAGVSRDTRSHWLRGLIADAVGLAPAAVVDADRFGASAAVTVLSSASVAFRAGMASPSVAGVLWEVVGADPWSPTFLGARRRAQLSGPAAAAQAAALCRRRSVHQDEAARA